MLPDDIVETAGRALAEDLGDGDRTAALIPEGARATGSVISREEGVLCGTAWFEAVFARLDRRVRVRWDLADGDPMGPGARLCRVAGPTRALLSGERTALNLLQTLSGTATLARRYAGAVQGTGARVLDTRKTVPGLRAAQKYAVRCGGGHNHRMGLYDAVLIKENHILAAGSITRAVGQARASAPGLMVEVEVENLTELAEALRAEPDRIMLDNFSLEDCRQAVRQAAGRVPLELSGNVTLERVRALAETGVDFVSAGHITKDVRAIDLSLRLDGPAASHGG